MIRKVAVALTIAAIMAAMTGCTGSTPQPQEPEIAAPTNIPSTASPDPTVAIDGDQWTCKDIVDTSSEHCNPLMQRVFDDYGWNLYRFINEGELNELKAQKVITPDKIAYVGLVACATMTGPPTYDDYFLAFEHDGRFKTMTTPKPALADAWSEAEKLLCFTKEEAMS